MKTNPYETNHKFWLSAAIGLALLFVAAIPRTARAQWASSGNNINNTNTGPVGIGTTSPASILTVQTTGPDSTGDKYLRVKNTNSFTGLLLDPGQAGDAGWLLMGGYPNAGDFTIRQLSFANHLTIKKDTGNVGIGTTAPPTKLSLQPAAYSSAVDGIEFVSSDNTTHSIIQPIKIAAGAMNLVLASNAYIDTTGTWTRFNTAAANASINVRSSDGTIRFTTN